MRSVPEILSPRKVVTKIQEQTLIVNETADKVIHQVLTKLPEEVLTKLDVMGGLKEKLYNYVNQTYVNMFNRYTVTMEDEFIKKVREFVDREEAKGLAPLHAERNDRTSR